MAGMSFLTQKNIYETRSLIATGYVCMYLAA
jgi:hypothetical protein